MIQAARDHEVSWPIAQAAFAAHTRLALPAETPVVTRLGIDEIRGKARFRLVPGDAGDPGWQVTAGFEVAHRAAGGSLTDVAVAWSQLMR